MEEAIRKAIEGGWKSKYAGHKLRKQYKRMGFWAEKGDESSFIDVRHALLDPKFWQAVGKSLGWKQTVVNHIFWVKETDEKKVHTIQRWENEWHNFISHLAEGKDIDSFFKELLNGNSS